uniref:SFRICE042071.2 n=1 Tax=Spodoptera frugiperda TaxID=7108 RepID=A0A2H1WY90_SPOFR
MWPLRGWPRLLHGPSTRSQDRSPCLC